MPQRRTALLVLVMMMTSGCLGAIDDIEDEFDRTVDIISADYPKLDLPDRTRTQPTLQSYDECDALLLDLKNALYDEMLVRLDQESYYHWVGWNWGWIAEGDDVALMDGAPESAADDSGSAASSTREGEFSETNNQEAGVDEADFLKTDGYHIYMLNGQSLVIMDVPEFGQVGLISETEIEGTPLQMMIDGDRMVIASMIYAWNLPVDHPLRELLIEEVQWGEGKDVYTYYRVQNLVKYTVVDITDRAAPEVERELFIEGNYHTARMIDGTVRSVTHNYANFEGLRYWVDLPSDYWQLENEDDRKSAWEYHLSDTIQNNEDVINDLTLDDFAPHMYEMTNSGLISLPTTSEDCSEFAASTDSVSKGFTTIMTFQLLESDVEVEVDHIASSWAHVYASQDMLILAEPANDWWWFWRNTDFEDATNIHVFDISGSSETTYVASGRVAGTVQDQFSISEYNGVIRVATTEDAWGRWWMEETEEWTGPTNNVFTLEVSESCTCTSYFTYAGETMCSVSECTVDSSELIHLGHVGDIAPNERIWSARFVGDRGYLVTFRNIDPLWVIDLSDPTNPTILGELEVPGVSTYIHPVDEDTLLTIGIGPGEDGLGLDWSMTQISLFDVSDPTNPTLADSLPLSPAYTDENCEDVRSCGWSWSWSEATYEHKAFTYWAPENLLAVPLSTYRYVYDEVNHYYNYEYISMLKLINVDAENLTLSEHGEVDHSPFYNNEDSEMNWWYSYSTNIRRSIFMGDYVYAFSALGVTVHRTTDLVQMENIEIPGHEMPSWYVEEEECDDCEDSDSQEVDSEEEGDSDGEGSDSDTSTGSAGDTSES
ncbi:beta-propeller domain-containing protein [Candidatus Poseidoniales archaeon]|nr:beta-propeller domain-containing protein [Candidatus Poseidoniales archaeon]